MNVNFGFSPGYFLRYGAHSDLTSYPAQSSTCSGPDSAAKLIRAACAKPARPATRPAPPVIAASLSSSCRLNCRSMAKSPSLIARWADDPHHFCRLVVRVRDAVRRRAPVPDAVAGSQLVLVISELEPHGSAQNDEELFGVAVRI